MNWLVLGESKLKGATSGRSRQTRSSVVGALKSKGRAQQKRSSVAGALILCEPKKPPQGCSPFGFGPIVKRHVEEAVHNHWLIIEERCE